MEHRAGPRIGTRRTPVAATSTPHRRAGWRGIATGASDNPDRQPETRTDEEAAAAADRAAFERMTVAELKDLLRARGQRVGGKKAELVERATSPTSSVGAGFSTSTAASRDRSSSYASTAAKKKPKSPPRMVWEVTDPPLPPRAPKLDKATQPSITVLSWNVNSIRALLEKDPDVLDKLAASEDADVVVLQETKLQTKNVPELDAKVLANYPHRVWNCSTKKLGYSGTALFTKHETAEHVDRSVRDGRVHRGRTGGGGGAAARVRGGGVLPEQRRGFKAAYGSVRRVGSKHVTLYIRARTKLGGQAGDIRRGSQRGERADRSVG
jgi:hypothetical protein